MSFPNVLLSVTSKKPVDLEIRLQRHTVQPSSEASATQPSGAKGQGVSPVGEGAVCTLLVEKLQGEENFRVGRWTLVCRDQMEHRNPL